MGISGLLPLLKSIQKHCTLKKFAGQTIGIDAYGWLHRGTVACAIELALDKPTTKYVEFAMGRVRMLLDFGITPYLVFDGDALPSKAGTNKERRKKRDESKAIGLELYRAGKVSQAHQELQKAADVTPLMARQLIEELKQLNIQYVVAPYEADAQLAYLEQKGIIDGILSEDSDLLVFGAKRLLTKLNQYGECIEIERADFASCREISLAGWTDAMFRRMAVLSGCDYLPNINKMGLKTAYRFVRKYKDADKILRMIQLEGQFNVPTDYLQNFKNAELAFLHHRVFCPIQQKLVFLNDLDSGTKEEDLPFLGPDVDAETAIGVACGELNPRTKEPVVMKGSNMAPKRGLRDQRRQTLASSADLKSKQSIHSFFKRQPLTELDPNSLTPSPSQQRLLLRHANSSWEPRIISSAPQLRRTSTQLAPAFNSRHTRPTDQTSFLARAATMSAYKPPKRQRLCSENDDGSLLQETIQSPFFSGHVAEISPLVQKKSRGKKARKSDFEVYSDDSIDEILLSLPDLQQTASPDPPEGRTRDHIKDFKSLKHDDVEAILESSPLLDSTKPGRLGDVTTGSKSMSANACSSQNDTPQSTAIVLLEPDNVESKVVLDLFELDATKRREELLNTFACQSPPRRVKALASLSSSLTAANNSLKQDNPGASLIEQSWVAGAAEEEKSSLLSNAPSSKGLDGTCELFAEAASAETSVANIHQTFAYQNPSTQTTALRSLGQPQTQKQMIELGRAALNATSTTGSRRPERSALQRLKEQALRTKKGGVARNSVDEKMLTSTGLRGAKGSEDLIVPNSEDDDEDEDEDEQDQQKPSLNLKAYVFTTK